MRDNSSKRFPKEKETGGFFIEGFLETPNTMEDFRDK